LSTTKRTEEITLNDLSPKLRKAVISANFNRLACFESLEARIREIGGEIEKTKSADSGWIRRLADRMAIRSLTKDMALAEEKLARLRRVRDDLKRGDLSPFIQYVENELHQIDRINFWGVRGGDEKESLRRRLLCLRKLAISTL